MNAGRGTGSFRKVGDRYEGYTVVDADGEKIGTVDTTHVDESSQREYVAVRRGLAGLIPSTRLSIIPMDVCAVDNTCRTIQASVQNPASAARGRITLQTKDIRHKAANARWRHEHKLRRPER